MFLAGPVPEGHGESRQDAEKALQVTGGKKQRLYVPRKKARKYSDALRETRSKDKLCYSSTRLPKFAHTSEQQRAPVKIQFPRSHCRPGREHTTLDFEEVSQLIFMIGKVWEQLPHVKRKYMECGMCDAKHPCIHLRICQPSTHPSSNPSTYLLIYSWICPSIHPSIYLSLFQSTHLFIKHLMSSDYMSGSVFSGGEGRAKKMFSLSESKVQRTSKSVMTQ